MRTTCVSSFRPHVFPFPLPSLYLAYDLCHRFTSAQNSRHIDRKLFKMRELRGAGMVTVELVPTEINPADIFTKILSRQVFERHRKAVLNLTDETRPRLQLELPYPSTRMSTWLAAGAVAWHS